jgi:hypothetical protein
MFGFDVNSRYPSLLIDKRFNIPIKEGKLLNLTSNEFIKLTYFKYGIYRCIVHPSDDEDINKLFQLSAVKHYTHYDLTLARELGLKMEIIVDDKPNFLYYSNDCLIKSYIIFEQYVNYLYDLKQETKDDKEINGLTKIFLNIIWGAMCEKNRKQTFVLDENREFRIPEKYKIDSIKRMTNNHVKLSCNSVGKIYKNDMARLGCFLTSFGRLQLVRDIKKYNQDIICIKTDAIYFKTQTQTDFKIGDKLGEWKVDNKL